MNIPQNNSHECTFDLFNKNIWNFSLHSENKLTIDTSFTGSPQCMVPPPPPVTLDYFDISNSSTSTSAYDSSDGVFYCPVPLSPGSASVESLLSFSLETPSPSSVSQTVPMFFPSPETNLAFSTENQFSTNDFDSFIGTAITTSTNPTNCCPTQHQAYPSLNKYGYFAYTSDSIRPNNDCYALETEQSKKRKLMIGVNFIAPFEENQMQVIDGGISMASKKSKKTNRHVSTGDSKTLKPFVCNVCSRPFARKHDLQRHTRVHTGVKPYSCLHCKKAFIRTDALKHHLRVVETCRMSPIIQAMKNSGDRRYRNL